MWLVAPTTDGEDFHRGKHLPQRGDHAASEIGFTSVDRRDDVHDVNATRLQMIGHHLKKLARGEVGGDGVPPVVGISEDHVPFALTGEVQEAACVCGMRGDAGMLVELEELAAHVNDLGVDLDDIDCGLRKITRDILRHAKGTRPDEQRAGDLRRLTQQGELPVFLVGQDQLPGLRVHAAFLRGVEREQAALVRADTFLNDADSVVGRLTFVNNPDVGRLFRAPAHGGGDQSSRDDLPLGIAFGHDEGDHRQQQQGHAAADENGAHLEGGEQEKAGYKGAHEAAERAEHADRARRRADMRVLLREAVKPHRSRGNCTQQHAR